MQIDEIKKRDAFLFSEFKKSYIEKFHHNMEYGTAGFRTQNQYLDLVAFRCGLIVSLYSRMNQSKVIGLMITASHNPIEDNGIKITDFDGCMLRTELEPQLEIFVNEPDVEKAIHNFLNYVEKMPGGKKIEITQGKQEGYVFLGGDTRPSTERLLQLAIEGVTLGGSFVRNFKQVTTPMLHFFVYFFNGHLNENYKHYNLESTTQEIETCYHKFFGEKFLSILETLDEKTREKLKSTQLLIDASNGIGGPSVDRFFNGILKGLLNVEIINKNDLQFLNDKCGAEFVQKEVKYPLNAVDRLREYQEKKQPARCICFDGDADRIVFYLPTEKLDKIRLLDGDKLLSLFAFYFKRTLDQMGAIQEEIIKNGAKFNPYDFGAWKVGTAQTAYANGSSVYFLRNVLKIEAKICPTGVKNLHPAAHHFDVGVYFESNGHGTVLFNENKLNALKQFVSSLKKEENPLINKLVRTATQFILLLEMSNQAVGDAMSVFFCIETTLLLLEFSSEDWEKLYTDFPSKTTKVHVKDKSKVLVSWDQSRITNPIEIQDAIDEILKAYPKGRSFVRPSGTEDVLRVYAEGETEKETLEISEKVTKVILENKTVN